MDAFDYLLDNNYFNEDELLLVIKAFGDNRETYNKICYVRYGYDLEQLADQDGEYVEIMGIGLN